MEVVSSLRTTLIDVIPTQYDQTYDYTQYWLFQSEIITINIEKASDSVYTYRADMDNLNPCVNYWYSQTNNAISMNDKPDAGGRVWTGIDSGSGSGSYYSEYEGTLEGALQHIANRFRNVDIYVDGELWSAASRT